MLSRKAFQAQFPYRVDTNVKIFDKTFYEAIRFDEITLDTPVYRLLNLLLIVKDDNCFYSHQ